MVLQGMIVMMRMIFFWNDDDDEVLDVDDVDDDDEFELLTPSCDQTIKHPSNEQTKSQQPFTQNQDSIKLTTEGNINPFIEAYRGSIQSAIDLINGQWSYWTWEKSKWIIEALASADEV